MAAILSDFVQAAILFLSFGAAAFFGIVCGKRYREITYTKESNR